MSAFKERSFGLLVYGGAAAFVVFFFAGCLVALGSMMQGVRFQAFGGGMDRIAGACIVLSAVGFAAMAFGLAYGVIVGARQYKGSQVVYPRARVVARYALDSNMVMHTTENDVAYCDRPRFYVRLDVGPGDNEEYRCAEPVFWQAGEGMWGEARVQGKWLGSFVPLRVASSHRANETIGL